jgi:hypothetical protein
VQEEFNMSSSVANSVPWPGADDGYRSRRQGIPGSAPGVARRRVWRHDLLLAEELLVYGELIVSEGNVIADLHLVEKPIRIALQDFREVDTNVACGFAEAVHDAAQRGFMNPQHARQTILPDAGGVHPKLEVRVNVSIRAHVITLGFYGVAVSCGEQE